ncbi:MAG: GPR endopeptidase [Oscillospiraceae bacterium]|nr:GPR endopeptidase [Oscillospiraceae bacterium]
MGIRTDLVLEEKESRGEIEGARFENRDYGEISVSFTEIISDTAARKLSKPKGRYITVEFDSIEKLADYDELTTGIVNSVKKLLPEGTDDILLVGLGNSDITPDALGPLVMNKILATRHISRSLANSIGLKGLKKVSVLTPGVLGKTGIETAEIIMATVEKIKPSAVITVDALAARKPHRLCNTVQLTDTGISPGSGVNNSRKEISQKTLGVPVISIGIPTVVDISKYKFGVYEECKFSGKENMIVTPKDIDNLITKSSLLLASALNIFLQPNIDENILLNLI